MIFKRKRDNDTPKEALDSTEGHSEYEGMVGDGVAGASDIPYNPVGNPLVPEATGPAQQARVFLGSLVAEYENDEEGPLVGDGGIQPTRGMDVVEVPHTPSKPGSTPPPGPAAGKLSESKAWGGFLRGRQSVAAEMYEKGLQKEEAEAKEAARTQRNIFTDSEVAARAAADRPVGGELETSVPGGIEMADYSFEDAYGGRTIDGGRLTQASPHIVKPDEVVFEGGETLQDHLASIRRDIEAARAAGARKRAEEAAARAAEEAGVEGAEAAEEQAAEEALRGWADTPAAATGETADSWEEGGEEFFVDPGASWGEAETEEEIIVEGPAPSSWEASRVWEEASSAEAGEAQEEEATATQDLSDVQLPSGVEEPVMGDAVLADDGWGDPIPALMEEPETEDLEAPVTDLLSLTDALTEEPATDSEPTADSIEEPLAGEPLVEELLVEEPLVGGLEEDAPEETPFGSEWLSEISVGEELEEEETAEPAETSAETVLWEEAPTEAVEDEAEAVSETELPEEAAGARVDDGSEEATSQGEPETADPFWAAVAEGVDAGVRLFENIEELATVLEAAEEETETTPSAADDDDKALANWDAEWGEPEEEEDELSTLEGPLFEEEVSEEELDQAWEEWTDPNQPSLEEEETAEKTTPADDSEEVDAFDVEEETEDEVEAEAAGLEEAPEFEEEVELGEGVELEEAALEVEGPALEEEADAVVPADGVLKWVRPEDKAATEEGTDIDTTDLTAEELLAAQELPLNEWAQPNDTEAETAEWGESSREEALEEESPGEENLEQTEETDDPVFIEEMGAGTEDQPEEEAENQEDTPTEEDGESDVDELPTEEELNLDTLIEDADTLTAPFAEAQLEWAAAWSAYHEGHIDENELRARAGDISIEVGDAHWMIGFQTGQWYRATAGGWEAATPPTIAEEKAQQAAEEAERFSQLQSEMAYVEKEARRILAKYAVGKLTYEEAGQRLENLIVDDGTHRYQYGVQSGRWYIEEETGYTLHGRHIAK